LEGVKKKAEGGRILDNILQKYARIARIIKESTPM